MILDDCTEAVCNYWEDISKDQQQTILDQLCGIATNADELRRTGTASKYERTQGRALRVRALREIDGLIDICEGIWGKDGP